MCAPVAQAAHEVVHLAVEGALRERFQVLHELVALGRHEALHLLVLELLVPERAHVAALHLRRLEDLAEEPQHAAVDMHELGGRDGVRLVEHQAYLLVVRLERQDDLLEFVRDVDLVAVKEEQNLVCFVGKPLDDLEEIVVPLFLLLAGEDAGAVDERNLFEERHVRHLGDGEPVEERRAERAQVAVGRVRIGGRGGAGHEARGPAVLDRNEAVRGRLGTDVTAGEVGAP